MAPILGKVQIGKETVHGTAVAATKMIPIVQGPLPVDRKVTELPYDIGVNAQVTGRLQQGVLVQDTLSWDQGAFQLLPYLLSGGLKGNITPVEQTPDQDDYLWTFAPSLTADNALDSFTLERGDNVQAVKHAYAMFKRIHISGQVNQDGGESAVKLEADYFAQQNVNGAFTAALVPLSMTYMSAKLMNVYLDSAWADLGDTALEGLLRSFDLDILPGAYPDFNGGSTETYKSHEQGPLSAMLTLTLKRGVTTEALRAAINEMRFARVELLGPVIGTGEAHSAVFDLAGYVEDVVAMASNDRQKSSNLDTLVLHGQYDATSGKLLEAAVTTNVASL
jgi:hypothetical protein